MEEAIGIIYEGWKEYRRNIQGYLTTPSKLDIEDWERFKEKLFNAIEAKKNDTGTVNQG